MRPGGDPGEGRAQAGLPTGNIAASQLGWLPLCSSVGMEFLDFGFCGGETTFSLVDPNSD